VPYWAVEVPPEDGGVLVVIGEEAAAMRPRA
jgi:hypothetical protein